MFGVPSIRLGRIFGIPVEINATWVVIFVLVALSLSTNYFPSAFPGRTALVDVASGILTALLFFASIVAHEMSHSLVARAGGIRIAKVTLFMFGGVAQMEEEPRTAGGEFVMAVAGPAMSLLLAAVFGVGAAIAAMLGLSNVIWGPMEYLAMINLTVAVFNMLPGFPLDGGRVFRAMIWALTGDRLKATRWAARSGQVMGFGLVVLAVFGVLRGQLNLIWLGLIGWFIASLAESSLRQQIVRSALEGLTARDLMSRAPAFVPGEIDISTFVHDWVMARGHTKFPVVQDGRVTGIVTLDAVRAVPSAQWGETSIATLADRDIAPAVVQAGQPAESILEIMGTGERPILLVVDGGRLAGVITRADVIARLGR